MDLSKYREQASINKTKIDAEVEKTRLANEAKEKEESILKLEQLTNKAKQRFEKIPELCERAAKNGEFECCIFSIDCDEANCGKSEYSIIYSLLCKMVDDDNIKSERRYRYEKDHGYGEDYIRHDDSYYDLIIKF